MDSNRLKYFLVVSETESLRKAAEILHLSPAALSKAIKQLEFEVGATLLIPAGRGIAITAEGRELAAQAQPIIENLTRLKIDFKNKKRANIIELKPLQIGTFEIFSTYFLKHLTDALPTNSELILHEAAPGDIEIKLLHNEIDYGITSMPIPTNGIQHKKITQMDLKIFGCATIFQKVAFEKLPFVVPIQPILKSPNKITTLDSWPDEKITRFMKYKVNMLESALELCRQGKAVAFLPTFIVKLHNSNTKLEYNLQEIAPPPELSLQQQTVYLAKRKLDTDKHISALIENVLKKI